MTQEQKNRHEPASGYFVGDNDQRPWGSWCVTGVGETDDGTGYCEKIIVVNPGKVLSLQSHEFRGEEWTVLYGTLLAIVDGRCVALNRGEKVEIPLRAIHTMANLIDEPCLVHERQQGICREEDIIRYVDANGRNTVEQMDKRVESSVNHYQWIAGVAEERNRAKESGPKESQFA